MRRPVFRLRVARPSHHARLMKRTVFVLSLALVAACNSRSRPAAPVQQASASEIRTIDSVPPRPALLEPPPMLSDEAPPPKPKALPWETPTAIVFSAEDEKVRGSLPFSPAIAMDPIDGSKISIRAATPTWEYKGKIYYFANDGNRRTFMSNPDGILKGGFTKL